MARTFAELGRIFISPAGFGPIAFQVLRSNVVQQGGDVVSKLDSTVSIACVHESVNLEQIDEMKSRCKCKDDLCFVDSRWMLHCIRKSSLSEPTVLRGKFPEIVRSDASLGAAHPARRARDQCSDPIIIDSKHDKELPSKRQNLGLPSQATAITVDDRISGDLSPGAAEWVVDLGDGITVSSKCKPEIRDSLLFLNLCAFVSILSIPLLPPLFAKLAPLVGESSPPALRSAPLASARCPCP